MALAIDIPGGQVAVNYMNGIPLPSYVKHDFPLPWMGKVMRNPVEQANSGFLPICQFAPLKLLIELWFYLLGKFNEHHKETA